LGVKILIFGAPLLTLIQKSTTLFPDTPYSINLSGMLNIFIPFFTFLYLWLNPGTSRNSHLHRPITLFLSISLLTILISHDKWITLREWFGLAMPITLYFLILASFRTKEDLDKLRKILIYSVFIPLAFSLFQIFNGEPDALGLNRVYGTFAHPNGFACYLVVLMPLVVYLYQGASNINRKTFYLVIFALMLLSLFCTYTRVAWVAFLVSMLILGFSKYKKFYLKLILISLIILLFIPGLNQIFLNRIQPDDSFYGRFSFNQFSLTLFSQKPILGHGLGTYALLSTPIFGEKGERYGRTSGAGAHNDYLRTLAETGIIGLFAFLFLFYSLFKMGRRIYQSGDYSLKSEALVLLAVLVSILVYGLTDFGLAYGGIYLWTLIGLVEAKSNLRQQRLKTLL
jgi:O-antigen ligase